MTNKIKAKVTPKTIELLSFYNIKAILGNGFIMVDKADFQLAKKIIEDQAPVSPKEKTPKKSQGARPTLESKGLRRKARLSVTIDAEANDWLYDCIRDSELVSHVLGRIILEHKTLTSQPPLSAKYGLWSHDNNRWIEYYWTDEEAAEAAENCGQSGLNFNVCGVNGNDDEWLNEIEV